MTAPPQLRHRQRGAFSILTAFTLIVLLLFLVLVIDSGRLYMEQRNLQKLADTAALESVSRLPQGHCAAAPDDAQRFAEENARRNHFLQDLAAQSLTSQCVALHTHNGLRQATPDPQGMAVQVTVGQLVSTSLIRRLAGLISRDIPEHVSLQAVAVAVREEPTAVFSIGSQLLRLDNSRLLGQLLRAVGVNVSHLTLLDSQGLADTQVTPAGLLQQLGVDIGIHQLKALSPQGLVDLVDTEVGLLGLDELVAVSLELVSDSVLKAELQVLRQEILANPILRDMEVRLLGTDDDPGLLSLTSSPDANSGSALEAGINLGELLGVALLTGTRERGLVIPDLNILGLAQVELGVVEPPSIGIGPVGTKAYNAQIRLYVQTSTSQALGGLLGSLLGGVLSINLPLHIDLISGNATLEAINCAQDTPTADIRVATTILNACVGNVPEPLKWSTSASCDASLEDTDLVTLLGTALVHDSLHTPALNHHELLLDMIEGETVASAPNPLALNQTVQHLLDEITELLRNLSTSALSSLLGPLGSLLGELLGGLLGVLNTLIGLVLTLLAPVLDLLRSLLTTLLYNVLGLELGRSDVTLHSLSCGAPQLVR